MIFLRLMIIFGLMLIVPLGLYPQGEENSDTASAQGTAMAAPQQPQGQQPSQVPGQAASQKVVSKKASPIMRIKRLDRKSVV